MSNATHDGMNARERVFAGLPRNDTGQSADGIHTVKVADPKQRKEGAIKTVMLSPCDPPSSAMSGIQTALDNLMAKIDGWLATITSYIDKASAILQSLQDMINFMKNIACEIAKYIKILMDKLMEYVLKMLNKTLTVAVAAIPSTMRHMFGNIKEKLTELICCLYNKLTDSMCGMIADLLAGLFPLEDMQDQAKAAADADDDDDRTTPFVPMCCAEDIVGQIFASHQGELGEANQTILDNLSTFISDIQDELAGVTDALSDITSPLGDIMGSITAALGFENLKLSIFGCELEPSCPVADYYTLEDGGGAEPDNQAPSANGVQNATDDHASDPPTSDPLNVPYDQPDDTQGNQNIA